MATPEKLDAGLCAKMIAQAAESCPTAQQAQAAAASTHPDWDAMATVLTAQGSSVAAQANAITQTALLIAFIALVLAFAWGYLVRRWAMDLAQKTVRDWMNENGPSEIAKLVRPIAGPPDGPSPEDQAKGLSEDAA